MNKPYRLAPSPWWPQIRRWLLSLDILLLLIVALLGVIGMVTLYSASDVFLGRFDAQWRNWLLAFAGMLIVSQIRPPYLRQLAVPLYVLGILLLLLVDLFGETRKGATRWLNLGVTSIQPSELMKIAAPMMLAWWFHQRQSFQSVAYSANFVVAFTLLALPMGLIILEPDLGTALLVLASGIAVIFFAGLSWRLIIPFLVLVVVGVVLITRYEDLLCKPGVDWFFLRDFQVRRVCTLLNPYEDPQGGGFHIIQSTIAIGSGGVSGKGFMKGTQVHLNFLPEGATDFIFAVYAEEFGLIGNAVLLFCYLLLLGRGLIIAARAVSLFSRLLAGGITLIFFACIFVNIGMVSGVLPVVGVPLPFMSYGGTALATFGMGIGILMSISAESWRKKHEHT